MSASYAESLIFGDRGCGQVDQSSKEAASNGEIFIYCTGSGHPTFLTSQPRFAAMSSIEYSLQVCAKVRRVITLCRMWCDMRLITHQDYGGQLSASARIVVYQANWSSRLRSKTAAVAAGQVAAEPKSQSSWSLHLCSKGQEILQRQRRKKLGRRRKLTSPNRLIEIHRCHVLRLIGV